MQPLRLYMMYGWEPNVWKVMLVLRELDLPFEPVAVDWDELHTPAYEPVNPNGRVPALVDPNAGDLKLWESGAIIEYLVERYDREYRLHRAPPPQSDNVNDSLDDIEYQKVRWAERQYLYFQVSGQGPYFGQAVWFAHYHAERVASARARYVAEVARVSAVLDGVLSQTRYLTGDSISYADIAFLPWYWIAQQRLKPEGDDGGGSSGGGGDSNSGDGTGKDDTQPCNANLLDSLRAKHTHFAAWLDALNARRATRETRAMLDDPALMLPARDVRGNEVKLERAVRFK